MITYTNSKFKAGTRHEEELAERIENELVARNVSFKFVDGSKDSYKNGKNTVVIFIPNSDARMALKLGIFGVKAGASGMDYRLVDGGYVVKLNFSDCDCED